MKYVEIRMVYLKFDKWSPVCLIKYVWLNIFQHFGPTYELIHTYGLFGTEEYMKFQNNKNRAG